MLNKSSRGRALGLWKSMIWKTQKISDLITERKNIGYSFDIDRFVFDVDEDSGFNILKTKSGPQYTETEMDYYNYSNSMTPYAHPRKKAKQAGCLPCQPKGYKDSDNACCIIYWDIA